MALRLLFEDNMYNIHYLKNGIRLVFEKMPYLQSVSIGVFVKSGSMYETKEENGISHFIEHMLFKGTTSRSAKKIAEEMDYAGGHINAYTSRECTCYYTRVLAEDVELSVDILSDMYYNSLFDNNDIELERGVIIEEINMYEDSPEDVALDTVAELMWKGSSLGYTVAGTQDSVSGITRDMLLDYMKRRYTPQNTVISVAGCFDEEKLIELFKKYFSSPAPEKDFVLTMPEFISGQWERTKDIEQTHLSIAYPAFDMFSDKLYSLSLLNNIFGGSMSSRLFQKVREENGLCYSIYSYTAAFPLTGMLGIYAGLSSDMLDFAAEMIDNEINRICTQKVSDYELEKARSQSKCSIIMGRESVSSRMAENGKSLLLLDRVRDGEEILSGFSRVTPDAILSTANEIFRSGKKAVFTLKN